MHPTILSAAFLTCTAAVLASSPTRARSATDDGSVMGEVELLVRGPDGRPVTGAEVRVVAIYAEPDDDRARREATARTDGAGLVRLPRPAGVNRFRVAVPGVGYGVTGVVEVLPGGAARAPLAPLVPFAVLEGTIPADLLGPKTVVELSGGYHWPAGQSLTVRADGRFRAEVPAGRWWVAASRDGQRVASVAGSVTVMPGQTVTDVTVSRVPPAAAPAVPLPPIPARPAENQAVTWAKGTVRDAAGRPVAGASVWAVAVHHGGLRMYETAKKTATDAEGRYEIKGGDSLSMFSASLVAHAPGKPPAWAWIRERREDEPILEGAPAPTVDLVLPDRGGRLEVTVVQDGQPAAGVAVGVWLEGVNLRDVWAAGANTPERKEVEAVVHPVVTADAAGVARFDALLPGRYRVIAAAGNEPSVRALNTWGFDAPEPYAAAEAVSVGVGRTTAFRMAISRQPNHTRVQIFQPNGQPLTRGRAPYSYSSIGGGAGWSTSQELDADGAGRLTFGSAGLWRVSFKYRDSPTRTIPLQGEPYYAAEGVVAVSSHLSADRMEPARLTARRFEPGSVVVELKDAGGRPARGFVELDPEFMGATDEAGVVRFDGVSTWNYVARASLAGRPPVDIGEYDAPVPDERQLRGATAVLPEPVTTEPNNERRIILREQPVGYLLGTVRPPPGRGTADFIVYPTEAGVRSGARFHYRRSTGEFVAGPFTSGEVRLRLFCSRQAGLYPDVECGAQDVKVEAGQVARVALTPPAELPRPLDGQGGMLVGMGGLLFPGTGAEALVGRVLLPGGKDPALGAVVMPFGVSSWQPLMGLTDARGQIRAKGLPYYGRPPSDSPGDPPGPAVVAALLPGSHGATVVPLPKPGQPLEIVLPPPATVRGRVTVAGAAPPGRAGSIRVLAAYEGRDKARLGSLLGVQTTAQADGTFELAGLTPGRYTVQAALDQIWLSPSVAVDVTERPTDAVTLAIPTPGGPAVVKLIDPGGKPLPGRRITIGRPVGPLTSLLWPADWPTDGAGEARIPALEAGLHAVRVKDTDVSAEVVVPALPVDRAVEVTIRVGAGRER